MRQLNHGPHGSKNPGEGEDICIDVPALTNKNGFLEIIMESPKVGLNILTVQGVPRSALKTGYTGMKLQENGFQINILKYQPKDQ